MDQPIIEGRTTATSSRARRFKSTPPNVEIPTSTYIALRKLATIREQSLSATIFELAHGELARMFGSYQHPFLPTPFELAQGQVGTRRTFKLWHSDLHELELTLPEMRAVIDLLDLRTERPRVRQFVTALGGITVDVKRNRQGVRLTTNDRRLNLSRVEAEALTDALDRTVERAEAAH